MRKLLHHLPLVLAPVLFAVALVVLHRRLRGVDVEGLSAFLAELPPERVLLALLLSTASYLMLTLYDRLAFVYVGRPISPRRVGLAAFVGYAFSNCLGHTLFTGTPIRLRFYTAWGASAEEIARVVAFGILTHGIGYLALAGVLFTFVDLPFPAELGWWMADATPLGLLCLALYVAYVVAVVVRRRPLRLRGWTVAAPTPPLVAAQTLLGIVEWTTAGAVLYVLLGDVDVSFLAYTTVYLLTYVASISTGVPGGLGVFETLMVLLLTPQVDTTTLLGALIVYRVVYHFLPLAVAALLLAGYELWERRRRLELAFEAIGRWSPAVEPPVVALVTFLGGTALLFSAATPTSAGRLSALSRWLPWSTMELAHVVAGAAGAALLVVARGLYGRLARAHRLSLALLATGIVAALAKDLSLLVALFLCLALGTLVACRRHFHRRAPLTSEPLTPGWAVATAVVLLATVWLAGISTGGAAFDTSRWARIGLAAQGPRALRVLAAAILALAFFAARRLLQHSAPPPREADRPALERVATIAAGSPRAISQLAAGGHLRLLFDLEQRSFLMYAVERRSWFALGEPVGDGDSAEVVWRFRDLCARAEGRPVFLHLPESRLAAYVDSGLTPFALGEEGFVDLDRPAAAAADPATPRASEEICEGHRVEILTPSEAGALVPRLLEVAAAWADARTPGRPGPGVDRDVLATFPIAILRRAGGRREDAVTGFATVLAAAPGTELAVDLVRLDPALDAEAALRALVTGVGAWGRRRGYRRLALGMAPFGPDEAERQGLRDRLAVAVYLWGEHFRDGAELRRFKESFAPRWERRYLAAPAGLALPAILGDLTRLAVRPQVAGRRYSSTTSSP